MGATWSTLNILSVVMDPAPQPAVPDDDAAGSTPPLSPVREASPPPNPPKHKRADLDGILVDGQYQKWDPDMRLKTGELREYLAKNIMGWSLSLVDKAIWVVAPEKEIKYDGTDRDVLVNEVFTGFGLCKKDKPDHTDLHGDIAVERWEPESSFEHFWMALSEFRAKHYLDYRIDTYHVGYYARSSPSESPLVEVAYNPEDNRSLIHALAEGLARVVCEFKLQKIKSELPIRYKRLRREDQPDGEKRADINAKRVKRLVEKHECK